MKKILYSIFAIALAMPAVVSAATFSFAPTSATLAPGKVFSTVIFVSPVAGEKITTAKLSLKFPADLLQVVSFTPATGWIPLALPGSDLMDNVNGKLIKTGGLPAKVTSIKQFGTIVFKAKAAGNAKISTNADSMLIDTANANKYTASTEANFNIVKPAPKPTPKPKHEVKKKPKTEKKKSAVTKTEIIVETTKATTTEEVATTTATTTTASDIQGQTAAVSESTNTDSGFFNIKTIAFGGVFILLVIAWLFVLRKKKA